MESIEQTDPEDVAKYPPDPNTDRGRILVDFPSHAATCIGRVRRELGNAFNIILLSTLWRDQIADAFTK